jgi:hypothetical protein
MISKLQIRHVGFSEVSLGAWKRGDYSLVKDCPRLLKRVLRKKARARPGRRFFGEAHVAAAERYQERWYGSLKWLTSAKWSGEHAVADQYQTRFREALQRHFPELKKFQKVAAASAHKLRGRRPVGPDLSLTTLDKHRFIEVKLPGDRLGRHQLLGLALIAMFVQSDRPVSVEIVNLFSGAKPTASEHLAQDFAAICAQLNALHNN